MAGRRLQVWFLLILTVVSSERSDIQVGSVFGAVALFRVNLDEIGTNSCYRVRVVKYNGGSDAVAVYQWPEGSRPAERMSWEAEDDGPMSFHLQDLQKSDEGRYGCEVWRGWSRVLTRNATLKVKDCTTVPAVKAKPDSAATLRCSRDAASERQGPRNVTWVRVKGREHVALDSRRAEVNGTALTIRTVSQGDGGWYRCRYVTGQTQHCVDVRLNLQGAEERTEATVSPTTPNIPNTPTQTLQGIQRQTESRWTVIAVVVSAIIALMSVFFFGLLFYHRRKRRVNVTQPRTAGTPEETENNYDLLIQSRSSCK